MGSGSQCIRPDDPAFIVAFALGLGLAVFLARTLVRLEARLIERKLAWLHRSIAWGVAEGLAFVGPIALTALFDGFAHPGRSFCTSLVWRWYFVPPVVLVVTGIAWGALRAAGQRGATGHA